MKTPLRRGAVAVMAIAALAGAPAATAAPHAPSHVQPAATQTSETGILPTSRTAYLFGETLAKLEGKQLEITFLAEIIPHHRAAIEMAELELARGKDPEIREEAKKIIAEQQRQIDQFTAWLEKWYGLTPEQAMRQAPREARQEMAALEEETEKRMEQLRSVRPGLAFDKAFVRHMVPHHQAGIIEFLEPQSRAVHPQLREASWTGITSQEAQIIRFITWLTGQG